MIATFMTWPYGTITATKEECFVMGLKEDSEGLTRAVVCNMKTGELSVVDLKDVIVDPKKLRKLPLT